MNVLLILTVVVTAVMARPDTRHSDVIEGEFLVKLDEHIIKTEEHERNIIALIERQFNVHLKSIIHLGALTFIHVEGGDESILSASHIAGVKLVERNAIGSVFQCQEQPSPGTWGLDRLDQRQQLPYTDSLSDDAVYTYGERQGSGVTAYVLDTGIDVEHASFGGRAVWGYTAPEMDGDTDTHGHGTHCAGTIGSEQYGVAKDVALVAVKVHDSTGNGPISSVLAGMAWIVNDHRGRHGTGGVVPKSVVNISLGFPVSPSLDDAVQTLVDEGIVIVTAAGNSNADACNNSPGRATNAINIGATNVGDRSAFFTNFGECVDLFAPGVDVLSTIPGQQTDVFSGTSMAAPHVVGVVARYQSAQVEAPTPAQVEAMLSSEATVDVIEWFSNRHSSSPNLLLYAEC